ncbi:MAG: Efflux ABC transporter, ATP-binding protein, partial [uncultured Corynebacteriales bacterium]
DRRGDHARRHHQAVRRDPRRGPGVLRGPAGRVLRPARPERRRQDHAGGDRRGAAPGRLRLGHRAGPAAVATGPRAAAPGRRADPGLGVLHPHDRRGAPGHRRRPVRAAPRGRRRRPGAGRPGRQGRHPGGQPVRRAAAAAGHRDRAGARPGADLPGRADRGPGHRGPAGAVGGAARAEEPGPHRLLHHPPHGRGAGAVRPGGDPVPRPAGRPGQPGQPDPLAQGADPAVRAGRPGVRRGGRGAGRRGPGLGGRHRGGRGDPLGRTGARRAGRHRRPGRGPDPQRHPRGRVPRTDRGGGARM